MRTASIATAAAVLAGTAVDAFGTSDTCCGALASSRSLKNKVHMRDTAIFEQRISSIWSLSAQQSPWCVVLPESTKDASTIMKVISSHECPFAIRGGGHGTYAFANSVEDGITIDFGNMQEVVYDESTDIVSVGPGTISATVFDELDPFGITITGGRVAPVGLAGFITGGGNSFHSNSVGFGCDNVVNFEVVLSSGKIVNANENENRDLWIALRGSSGNLGLVTRFDLKAIHFPNPDVPQIFGGIVSYELSSGPEVINTYMNFVDNHAIDKDSSVILWWQYDSALGTMDLATHLDNSANIPDAPAINEFLAIEGVKSSTLVSDTLGNITRGLDGGHDLYNIWFTGTYNHDERLIYYSSEKHEQLVSDIIASITPGGYFFTRCEYQAITKTMVDYGNGDNVLGLERHTDKGSGILFLMYIGMANAEDEAIAIPMVQAYLDDIDRYADSLGINWNWEYLPYAHGLQDPITGYGDEALAKLKKASRKYDPKGVFQNLKGAGFKLPA